MSVLDNLIAQVAQTVTVEQSAAKLLAGLSAQLTAALTNNDTAALQSISAQLQVGADALSAAIVANTPAAAPAPAAPSVEPAPVDPATPSA